MAHMGAISFRFAIVCYVCYVCESIRSEIFLFGTFPFHCVGSVYGICHLISFRWKFAQQPLSLWIVSDVDFQFADKASMFLFSVKNNYCCCCRCCCCCCHANTRAAVFFFLQRFRPFSRSNLFIGLVAINYRIFPVSFFLKRHLSHRNPIFVLFYSCTQENIFIQHWTNNIHFPEWIQINYRPKCVRTQFKQLSHNNFNQTLSKQQQTYIFSHHLPWNAFDAIFFLCVGNFFYTNLLADCLLMQFYDYYINRMLELKSTKWLNKYGQKKDQSLISYRMECTI